MQATFELTADQKSFFEREGYLVLPQLTTADDVATLRQSYDRIFAQQAGRSAGDQFDLAGTDEEGKAAKMPQILNPAKYAPEMKDSLLFANATALCKGLFGEKATCHFAHAILKPAHSNQATPWHQDAAYWSEDFDYPASISIWVPLQDTPLEMGCMQFIAKSHTATDILRHQHINNDPRIHGLELHASELQHARDPRICPIAAGGATVHGGYCLHYTAPNTTDRPRRALILGGGLEAVKRSTPRDLPWLHESQTARGERAAASAKP